MPASAFLRVSCFMDSRWLPQLQPSISHPKQEKEGIAEAAVPIHLVNIY